MKTRWNAIIQVVTSFVILQALICFIIVSKSVASPHIFPAINQSETLLTLVQNNEVMLVVHNASRADSGPVPLDIDIDLNEISGYAFLMFRGVPDNFKLSEGFRVKKSWMVSLRNLDELKLIPPADYVGQLELIVLLVRERNETVESHKMLVSIGQSESTTVAGNTENNEDELLTSALPSGTANEQKGASSSLISQTELGVVIPSKLQLTQDQEQKLMERAADLVAIGEVSSARLMFEHLALKGSGLGAMALAQTYDPVYFRAMKILGGVSADPEKARIWYSIAAKLGQKEATSRLSALSDN